MSDIPEIRGYVWTKPDVSGYVVICLKNRVKRTKEHIMLQFGPFADMPQYFGKNTTYGVETLYVPQIGYTFIYEGKSYEILTVTTYQEKVDKSVLITHVLKCLEIDDNGEDVGSEPITLKLTDNSDKYGIVGF